MPQQDIKPSDMDDEGRDTAKYELAALNLVPRDFSDLALRMIQDAISHEIIRRDIKRLRDEKQEKRFTE